MKEHPMASANLTPEYRQLSALMQSRRSMRGFKKQEIDDDTIRLLVDTVRYAPSAGNAQLWEFIVVRDPEKKKAIGDYYVQQLGPKQEIEKLRERGLWFSGENPLPTPAAPFVDAGALIVVAGDPRMQDAYWYRVKLDKGHQHMVSSLANVVLSLHLTAASLGLGSHYVSDTASPDMQSKIKALLGIPDPLWCYETIPVGFADFAPSNRYVREVDDIIHWDQFDKSRLKSDRQVIDHIIDKIRPKKKKA
jgi:nitroreductase